MSYSSNIVFLLCDVNNNWAKYKCIACKYWQTFFFLLNINNPTLADLYLLYVKLLAFDCPSVREVCQGLADGPELLFSFLKLSVVFKVSGGWQRESIPDPNHKGEQDRSSSTNNNISYTILISHYITGYPGFPGFQDTWETPRAYYYYKSLSPHIWFHGFPACASFYPSEIFNVTSLAATKKSLSAQRDIKSCLLPGMYLSLKGFSGKHGNLWECNLLPGSRSLTHPPPSLWPSDRRRMDSSEAGTRQPSHMKWQRWKMNRN